MNNSIKVLPSEGGGLQLSARECRFSNSLNIPNMVMDIVDFGLMIVKHTYMDRTTHYTITVEYISLFSSHDGANMDVIELP